MKDISMNIRNFAIISHIDHGKSTLADRLLELTGTVSKEKLIPQYLDRLSLERERGITIKMQPVRMIYHAEILNPKLEARNNFEIRNSKLGFADSKREFVLNLIDTPGHADFSYEVSRALKAVEGAILLVDAVKGVQAQTIFNFRKALQEHLTIIPVINKVDLREANVGRTEKQLIDLFGAHQNEIDARDILKISAKTGQGVTELLEKAIQTIPAPETLPSQHNRSPGILEVRLPKFPSRVFQALIFDSLFDSFKGVLAYVRVFRGSVQAGDLLELATQQKKFTVKETGIFTPDFKSIRSLEAGDIGYIATGIKESGIVKIGDTIRSEGGEILEGFLQPKPNVFASLYPLEEGEFENLTSSLERLQLNDPAISFERTDSPLLGRGFRAGFLGKLHMEISAGRLDKELKTEIIIGTPTVAYEVNGDLITSPAQYPEHTKGHAILEPWVGLEIFSPSSYLGSIMKLIEDSQGIFKDTVYLDEANAKLTIEMPLASLVTQDFYDRLKSVSQGFASAEYEPIGMRPSANVRLDMLVAGEAIDAFSKIVPRTKAYEEGKRMAKLLKDVIPRAQFVISIQARLEGKVIAREDIPALKKAVTAPLYGGDFTRKKKLLVKQREGKKRMRQFGRVEIPKEVFLKVI